MAEKNCSKCGALKPIEEYYVRNKTTGVRRADCIECFQKRCAENRMRPNQDAASIKQCTKCNEVKPVEEFNLLRKNGTKRQARCKQCKAAYEKTQFEKPPQGEFAQKQCPCCGQTKSAEEFNALGRAGKRQSWCSECARKHRALARALNPKLTKDKKREWVKSNPSKVNFSTARRRAAKQMATPAWFESDKVARIYAEAAKRGFDVDHVVPLRSDIVCGLHCWSNLQLMDRSMNRSKNNRQWPDMP